MPVALKPQATEAQSRPMTTVEFDRWLDAQRDDTKWELIGGMPVAMTPPLIAHAVIVANLGDAITERLRGRTCRVFRGDVGMQSADDDTRTYRPVPDLLVQCGPRDLRKRFVADALAVVEVLSPSTMDDDRGAKLAFYKTVRTLRHIVLVYPDQPRVEHYRHGAEGWTVEVLTGLADRLSLDALGLGVPLETVYAEITFDTPAGEDRPT